MMTLVCKFFRISASCDDVSWCRSAFSTIYWIEDTPVAASTLVTTSLTFLGSSTVSGP
eukprot:CAMPEP_0170468600 /NCGR_PEP_ID=MMETSP0123-20130129/11717_1 /TAXON_ID=182087 /ORGANISM="Favella ehrenbergii, Strain Fehren 1" /LENGTH=57 /DNA_ID=CAMNT_0010735205 /DNA_START=571 /DNA_END=744 /DNA_ORIENTATION=+